MSNGVRPLRVRLREVEWAMNEFVAGMLTASSRLQGVASPGSPGEADWAAAEADRLAASHARHVDDADKLAQEFAEVLARMLRRGEDSESLSRLFEITSRTIRLHGAWLREATEAAASLAAGREAVGV